MAASTLKVTFDDGIAKVALARPDVRNAFNAQMIDELAETFAKLSAADDVRAVVLSGEGKSFCGGADIGWMRESLDLTFEENAIDAQRMSDMFRTIDNCPAPVIARIHGAALGGGSGLASVCDIVIAADDALFGFTEVKLGIIPAVISPFVVAKIGPSNARALFLTGERFDAKRAVQIGLAHDVVSNDELDARVTRSLTEIGTAGPYAVRAAKQLIRNVLDATYEDSREITSHAIANQRISPEGQEGLRAFLERRKAGFHR
ncbi:MAG TPA: enoyl-CoA hydratase-related protein [Candidatus Tumulicola sp.]|jgi:methylglutaconyl-CoA hydratase